MKITRAAASLLLLALILVAEATKKCANCGLGEGEDPCNCGSTAVRAKNLNKPDYLASAEAIKAALRLKKTLKPAPATIYTAPTASYGALAVPAYDALISSPSAPPAPSPVSYVCNYTPAPIRSKSFVKTKCSNGACSNKFKRYQKNDQLNNLLNLSAATSVAPKFEPIGDLCHTCKGYKAEVVGVIPARPGKLPCKCPNIESKAKPIATADPSAAYNAAAPLLTAAAAAAAAASYGPPVVSYDTSVPAYNVPAAPVAYWPTVTAPTPLQYAPAYQPSTAAIYVSQPTLLSKRSYKQSKSQSYDSNQNAITTHPSVQYAPAYQLSTPVVYQMEPATERSPKKSKALNYEQTEAQHGSAQASVVYVTEPAVTPKTSYQRSQAKENNLITSVAYLTPAVQQDSTYQASATGNYASSVPAQQHPAYQTPATVIYEAKAASPNNQKHTKSKAKSAYDKHQHEVETYVEIVLDKEETSKYTADPVSISLAYKNLAESHGKKYVAEDSLAYGHYKEPEDGRICKHVSPFDEEKLHTVDKPVVELKNCKCTNGNCQNLQVSYSDIGFGPVAPSKNRFVPKIDPASNTPYAQIIYVTPPPEDKDSLPYGPLGPTIPGYKSGSVIVSNDPNSKSNCGCKEGCRRAVLREENEQYTKDNYSNGVSNERIKSCSCKSGH